MSDHTLQQQAAEMEWMLPHLMRRLFTLDPDHPLAELPLAQLRLCSLLLCGPKTFSCLAEALDISPSAVTQLADRLERVGMVERAPDEEEDRRVKRLRLTAYGDEQMRSRRETRREHVQDALCRLSPEMRETVIRALRALLEANGPLPLAAEEPQTARQEITDVAS